MSFQRRARLSRRKLIGGVAAIAGLFKMTESTGAAQSGSPALNRNSVPSDLKITDMRSVLVASNYDYPIIRIDTNQGVYGLGEVRDAGREGTALVLKPHLVGQNPLRIEPILDRLRNFSNHHRGYDGGFSIEPHMMLVAHDKSVQSAAEARFANYVEYGRRVEKIVRQIGWKV